MPTLKIISDSTCSLFIDKKYAGELSPESISVFEIEQGDSLLEYKLNNELIQKVIVSVEKTGATMLEVSLRDAISAITKKNDAKSLCSSVAYVIKNEDGTADMINETFSTKQRIAAENFDFCSWGPSEGKEAFCEFDKAGLVPVNVGGQPDDVMGYYIEGGRNGAANKKGDIQVPIIYDNPIRFANEYTTVAQLEGEKVFINPFGEEAFENCYDSVQEFVGNYCVVQKDGLYGVIDYRGNIYLDIKYNKIVLVYDNGETRYALNRWSTPPKTFEDNIQEFKRDKTVFFCVTSEKGSQILNEKLKPVYPFVFQSASLMSPYLRNSVWLVQLNNRYGVYYFDKGRCIPVEYDSIRLESSFFYVIKGRKCGIYDMNRLVVPVEYSHIKREYDNVRHGSVFKAYSSSGGDPTIYDSDGQIIN